MIHCLRSVALAVMLLWLAGCQAATTGQPTRPTPDKTKSVEITPADEEFDRQRMTAGQQPARARGKNARDELSESELYELPKFTVAKKGFAKFGLSVVTNTEVAAGGAIEWMQVGVVLPDSPARRLGLFTGLEILALNDIPVARLSREDMLHLLFEREVGEALRLLVYSRHFGSLPVFITLR